MRWLLVAFLFFYALNNSVYASILHRNLEWVDEAGYGTMNKGTKSKSKGGKGKGYYPPPHPPLPPINQLCFTQLAAIWWSWYLCYYDSFTIESNTCPVQDKRVPAKTTFLFYDDQPQNCSSFKPNERYCQIPADNWIVLQAAGLSFTTDFVSVVDTSSELIDNTIDTPETIKKVTNELVDLVYKNVTAKIDDGNETFVPRYESQDLCNLETVDLKGCSSSQNFQNGWFIFSDAYWLRIPPTLGKGTHTIEVKNEGYLCNLFGNCPDPPTPSPYECSGTKYIITVV